MNPDVVLQILNLSPGRHWGRLCLLNESIWGDQRYQKWQNVLKHGQCFYNLAANKLNENELILWLGDKNMSPIIRVPWVDHCNVHLGNFSYHKDSTDGFNAVGHHCARKNWIRAIRWLIDAHELSKEEILMPHGIFEGAAINGHLNTIQWLVEDFQIAKKDLLRPNLSLQCAAENGHLHILNWLIKKLKLGA